VPAPARLVSGLRRPQAHINLLCMPDLMVAKLAAVARNGGTARVLSTFVHYSA
jgi:hypothetical protein